MVIREVLRGSSWYGLGSCGSAGVDAEVQVAALAMVLGECGRKCAIARGRVSFVRRELSGVASTRAAPVSFFYAVFVRSVVPFLRMQSTSSLYEKSYFVPAKAYLSTCLFRSDPVRFHL